MTINPIVVMVFTLIVLKERFSMLKLSGIFLGICGALTLLLNGRSFQVNRETSFGDMLTLINAVSWAVFVVMVKPYMQQYKTVTVMKWIFFFGIFLVFPFGINDWQDADFSSFTPHAWFAVLFVVIGTTFLAYLLNIFALKELSPSTVSAYIYLQPFLAIAFAIVTGKDEMTLQKGIAAGLIITGVYMTGLKPKKKII